MDDPALRQQVNHLEGRVLRLYQDLGETRGQLAEALGQIAALEGARTRLAVALRKMADGYEETRRTGLADEVYLTIAAELAEVFTAFADELAADEPGPEPEESEPDDYDPGPEVDDEGGMSEYRNQPPDDPF